MPQPKALAVALGDTIFTIDQQIRAIQLGPPPTIRSITGQRTLGNSGDNMMAIDAQLGFEIGTTPRQSLIEGMTDGGGGDTAARAIGDIAAHAVGGVR